MRFPETRIVGPIDRAESAISGDAALEFCRHFLHGRFLERIGATREENCGAQEENDSAGFQARRILKK
jgi:hypothetical protein